jgi:hypothetical protein
MRQAMRARGTTFVPQTNLVPKIFSRDAAEDFAAVVIPFSAGQLARAAQATVEAAKGWKSARSLPSSANMITLARALPSVKAWLYRQVEQGVPVEYDSPRVATALFAQIQRLAGQQGGEGDAARAILREAARQASAAPALGDLFGES